MTDPAQIVLETTALSKLFGGLTAVGELDLKVLQGQIHSLIGPNGAGKTTVFNVVTGIYRPERGRVLFEGQDITGLKPHRIVERGIARTFQNIRLFSNLTCRENVMAGRHCRPHAGLAASLLVLDEPSSGLNPRETEDLMEFIRRIIREEHLTVLLIEHDMNVVMGISDRVTVMDGGRKIAERLPRGS